MGVESYMHKYAKIVLAGWLRKKVRVGETYKGLDNIPIPVQKGTSPMFSVYMEYPICKDKQGNIIGMENTKKDSNPWDQWLKANGKKVAAKHNIPTNYELKEWENELTILHIFDIVMIDPASRKVHSIFEIMHQHEITDNKKKFIQENQVPCYEISAEWIMNKVKSPFHIDCIQTF